MQRAMPTRPAKDCGMINRLVAFLTSATTAVSCACCAFLASAGLVHAQQTGDVPAAQAMSLVAPESLEQGFIIVVSDKTKLSNATQPLYLACNHNNWNPVAPGFKLEPRSDMRWQIILPKPTDTRPLEFKFTRGSWDETETNADLTDLANRRLAPIDASKLQPGVPPIIELEIVGFSDQRPSSKRNADVYRAIEVTGTLRRLQIIGGGGNAETFARDALVWLPPGYDDAANAQRLYPVAYLMDGQNVFEALPGVPGEWQADETATRLIESGAIEPLIIVAIPHARDQRLSEYLPFETGGGALKGVAPGGKDFIEFLVTRVMPRVERSFRVRTGPSSTLIGGASMGAVISLHAAMAHPDIFGLVLLESMPRATFDAMADRLRASTKWPERIAIGIGDRELGNSAEAADANRALVKATKDLHAMLAKGAGADRVKLSIGTGHEHNEKAWAARLGDSLQFLMPAR